MKQRRRTHASALGCGMGPCTHTYIYIHMHVHILDIYTHDQVAKLVASHDGLNSRERARIRSSLWCSAMASLVPRALVFCALFLLAAFTVSAAVVPPGGKLLARSEFHWDNDGWKGYSKRRVVRVDVDMGQVRPI